jgi:Zn-dependent metalloprotease
MLRKLALMDDLLEQRAELLASADAASYLRGQRSQVAQQAQLAPSVQHLPVATRRRDVFDAMGRNQVGGRLVRTEGGPPVADPVVNQAYDATGTTWDFFFHVLARNSVDGRGLPLESTVHSAQARDNAFWNGNRMVFGDATPRGPFMGSFAALIDVVAHELTHGVTQYATPKGLDYMNQSGALNESWSDVFGSIVKQWSLQQNVKQADWLIGAGLLKLRYGKALRSLKAPGTAWIEDDQPSTMDGYVTAGDVHTNSGIPNKAFYLAADAIGGNAWDRAGPIWYRALPLLGPHASFVDAAHATVQAASALYGETGTEVKAVTAAWQAVKVL